MGMGFAPTWLRQVTPPPLPSQNHFNHWAQWQPVRRQTYGYLSSRRAPPLIGWCKITLLDCCPKER